MYENLKKISIKAKEKLKNAIFFSESILMKLDQSKIINCVPDFARLSKTILAKILCHNKTARRYKIAGIGIEIWYRYL